uniref:(northern house mosquito) hypothetical protein n=1 Tax=Culex pipiens TaxID=7175 RepID=A0A8D8H0Z5_CULPI
MIELLVRTVGQLPVEHFVLLVLHRSTLLVGFVRGPNVDDRGEVAEALRVQLDVIGLDAAQVANVEPREVLERRHNVHLVLHRFPLVGDHLRQVQLARSSLSVLEQLLQGHVSLREHLREAGSDAPVLHQLQDVSPILGQPNRRQIVEQRRVALGYVADVLLQAVRERALRVLVDALDEIVFLFVDGWLVHFVLRITALDVGERGELFDDVQLGFGFQQLGDVLFVELCVRGCCCCGGWWRGGWRGCLSLFWFDRYSDAWGGDAH